MARAKRHPDHKKLAQWFDANARGTAKQHWYLAKLASEAGEADRWLALGERDVDGDISELIDLYRDGAKPNPLIYVGKANPDATVEDVFRCISRGASNHVSVKMGYDGGMPSEASMWKMAHLDFARNWKGRTREAVESAYFNETFSQKDVSWHIDDLLSEDEPAAEAVAEKPALPFHDRVRDELNWKAYRQTLVCEDGIAFKDGECAIAISADGAKPVNRPRWTDGIAGVYERFQDTARELPQVSEDGCELLWQCDSHALLRADDGGYRLRIAGSQGRWTIPERTVAFDPETFGDEDA